MCSLVPQIFSWGQLQVTKDAFLRILACQHVFAPFLNIVHEFGSKTRDGGAKRDAFYGYHYSHDNCLIGTGSQTGHDYGKEYVGYLTRANYKRRSLIPSSVCGRERSESW